MTAALTESAAWGVGVGPGGGQSSNLLCKQRLFLSMLGDPLWRGNQHEMTWGSCSGTLALYCPALSCPALP